MGTNLYVEDVDIAELLAKNIDELSADFTSINPQESDHKPFALVTPGKKTVHRYSFTPYYETINSSLFNGYWANRRSAAYSHYKSSSDNPHKLMNAAAWGSAPIPKRAGLKNTESPYINTLDRTLESTVTFYRDWQSADLAIKMSTSGSYTTSITKANCIIIDVTARGGKGGTGYSYGGAERGGGGGGAGAAASLLVNLSGAEKITFDNSDSSALKIKDKDGNVILTLGSGGNGGDATETVSGAGGAGGTASKTSPQRLCYGIYLLWAANGAAGGTGGAHSPSYTGSAGNSGPSSIKFISDNTISSYQGGKGGGGLTSSNRHYCHGGGGGAGSIFSKGGEGGNKDYSTGVKTNTTAYSGAGGGGGYALESGAFTSGEYTEGGNGGGAYIRVYYESTSTETTEFSTGLSGGGSGSGSGTGGCVFAGTQIALDKNTNIDIVNFKGGTPIDFCNPDTLEHFPQQTLVRFISNIATKKIILWLEDGKTIALTPNHAVLTEAGFKAYLDDYMFPKYGVGEKLATVDGYKELVAIQEENIDKTTVYNIATENSLMVANGIIVAGELGYNIETLAIDGGFGGDDFVKEGT